MSELQINFATADDVPVLLSLIRGLADYEKMTDQVVATEANLREHLFGKRPAAEALLGRHKGEPVCFALFFHNFSTFLGQPGLYLEDLYVREEFRGRGFGKSMLLHLARLAGERKCGRFEWSVLDWNQPAIEFYKKIGATVMEEWQICRLTGPALQKLL